MAGRISSSVTQYAISPTGRLKVTSAVMLWVCKREMAPGTNQPKSGTMLPMTAAVNTCARVSGRYPGNTAAMCDRVNGITPQPLQSRTNAERSGRLGGELAGGDFEPT